MANSSFYRDLKREVKELRMQFLPGKFDPLGVYPDAAKVQAHTRAYLVLSHAAVETFVEAWAKDMARAAEVLWTTKHKLSKPLVHLAGGLTENLTLPQSLGVPIADDIPARFQTFIDEAFRGFYKTIRIIMESRKRTAFVCSVR